MQKKGAGSRGCFFSSFFPLFVQLTRTRFGLVAAHRKTGAQSADERLSRCSANRTEASQGREGEIVGGGAGAWAAP